MVDRLAQVRTAAQQLGVLGPNDTFEGLSSLVMMDLLVVLEEASGLQISPTELTNENFADVPAVARLLDRVAMARK